MSSLTSLLLAGKRIEHDFYVEKLQMPFSSFPPVSSPLLNHRTQLLEQKFINPDYLSQVLPIDSYEFSWYHADGQLTLRLSDDFLFPIHALDNRIRFRSFYEKISKDPLINLVETENIKPAYDEASRSVNIIGGAKFSSWFDEHAHCPSKSFERKRKLFFFNLDCDHLLVEKYRKVKTLIIAGTGYIILYPFLHQDMKRSLALVANVTEDGTWNVFNTGTDAGSGLKKLIGLIGHYDPELAADLSHCTLSESATLSIIPASPWFKDPVRTEGQKMLIGIGESVSKNDPVTGQGYNSGAAMGLELVKCLEAYARNQDPDLLQERYRPYADQMLKHLYHLNLAFSQDKYNMNITPVYAAAFASEDLRKHIMAMTYEDISLYFPWLTNQEAARRLIKKYTGKSLVRRLYELMSSNKAML